MEEATLPGVEREAGERIVLHVDMDCFYASCERLREPELRGEPVVVGMGYESGETAGAVATASYEAREHGVESAQAITTALERLPRVEEEEGGDEEAEDPTARGYYRPVDMEFYESVAAEVKAILGECADTVREVSVDEAYLDVTDRTAWEVVEGSGEGGDGAAADDGGAGRTLAEGYARHVKRRIRREVGVPASIGVAPDMATAKVASDHDKPDGLTVVRPGRVREFLAPLDVAAIHGVGPVTARELAEAGVETAGDLAVADPAWLAEAFGERGRELYRRARGEDDREVTPTGRPKSLNRESALGEATADPELARETVRGLAADVAERARTRGAMYRTIGVKVVTPPFDVNTRARSLPGPVDDPELVEEVALDLLGEFEGEAVRKLGVRVSNLSFAAADQARLDGWDGDGEAKTPAGRHGCEDPEDGGEPATGTDPAGQASLSEFDDG